MDEEQNVSAPGERPSHEAGNPSPDEDGGEPQPGRQMPLGIVAARIVIVSGMSFAAAFAIFFLVGALWVPSAIAFGLTALFLVLMFAIERGAE